MNLPNIVVKVRVCILWPKTIVKHVIERVICQNVSFLHHSDNRVGIVKGQRWLLRISLQEKIAMGDFQSSYECVEFESLSK